MAFKGLQLLISTLLLWASSSYPEPLKLNFRQALMRAEQESSTLKRLQAASKQANIELDLVDKMNLPQLASQAAIGTHYIPNSISSRAQSHSYGLSLSWPIYDFGKQEAKKERASYYIKLADASWIEARAQLIWQFSRSYLDVLASQALASMTLTQWQLAKSKSNEHSKLYKLGLTSEIEVVAAQVSLGKATLAHSKAQGELEHAKLKLASLLRWQRQDFQLNLSSPFAEQALQNILATVKSWQAPSLHPSIMHLAIMQETYTADLQASQAAHAPILQGVVSASESGDLFPLYPQAKAELRFVWDIPWQGRVRAEEDIISAKRQQTSLQAQESSERLEFERKNALLALSKRISYWEELSQHIRFAQRQKDLVAGMYATGKASALELSNCESTLLAFHVERLQVIREAFSAAIDYAQALGMDKMETLFP